MARIVIELTNRCNLRCQHCFDERHAGTGDLPLAIIETVLRDGTQCGVDHISFTGGEPTLHRQFREIVQRVCDTGYTFSFVTNGSTIPQIYPSIVANRRWLTGITFSLDGAHEETHDRLRGEGSYRQVMRAISVCVAKTLPFTFNMVLTQRNRHEVEAMVRLATQLGSSGVRFGHLMHTAETALRSLELSPLQRRETENEIWRLRECASVPVGLAPGYYSESPFFPCGPLELQEFNVDYRGRVTLCCQLSGHSGDSQEADVIGNLRDMTLVEACARFSKRVAIYLDDKRARVQMGAFEEVDHFPCLYCVKYLGMIPIREGMSSGHI